MKTRAENRVSSSAAARIYIIYPLIHLIRCLWQLAQEGARRTTAPRLYSKRPGAPPRPPGAPDWTRVRRSDQVIEFSNTVNISCIKIKSIQFSSPEEVHKPMVGLQTSGLTMSPMPIYKPTHIINPIIDTSISIPHIWCNRLSCDRAL